MSKSTYRFKSPKRQDTSQQSGQRAKFECLLRIQRVESAHFQSVIKNSGRCVKDSLSLAGSLNNGENKEDCKAPRDWNDGGRRREDEGKQKYLGARPNHPAPPVRTTLRNNFPWQQPALRSRWTVTILVRSSRYNVVGTMVSIQTSVSNNAIHSIDGSTPWGRRIIRAVWTCS